MHYVTNHAMHYAMQCGMQYMMHHAMHYGRRTTRWTSGSMKQLGKLHQHWNDVRTCSRYGVQAATAGAAGCDRSCSPHRVQLTSN